MYSRHRSGGNVGIAKRFPRMVGRAENLGLVFRAFHRSAFPRLQASAGSADPPLDQERNSAFALHIAVRADLLTNLLNANSTNAGLAGDSRLKNHHFTSSTLRFLALPSSVSFELTGEYGPQPKDDNRPGGTL